jgi:hypothetical protein
MPMVKGARFSARKCRDSQTAGWTGHPVRNAWGECEFPRGGRRSFRSARHHALSAPDPEQLPVGACVRDGCSTVYLRRSEIKGGNRKGRIRRTHVRRCHPRSGGKGPRCGEGAPIVCAAHRMRPEGHGRRLADPDSGEDEGPAVSVSDPARLDRGGLSLVSRRRRAVDAFVERGAVDSTAAHPSRHAPQDIERVFAQVSACAPTGYASGGCTQLVVEAMLRPGRP